MSIRAATSDDLTSVREIAEAAYLPYVAAIGKKPAPMVADFASQIANGQVWLFSDEEIVLGYVVAYPSGGAMQLENIAVDPAFHGRGVGKALVTYVEKAARRQGLKAVELYTNIKMTGNLSWYPAIGYSETGRAREAGFDRVFFRKDL
ncbi:MAG: GNAT family N-acetyltransferase [Hyphomicrobiales bacterium]